MAIKISNPDIPVKSVIINDKVLFGMIRDHFLSYKNENPIENGCITVETAIESVCKALENTVNAVERTIECNKLLIIATQCSFIYLYYSEMA